MSNHLNVIAFPSKASRPAEEWERNKVKTPEFKRAVDQTLTAAIANINRQAEERDYRTSVYHTVHRSEDIIRAEWLRIASVAGGARALKTLAGELDAVRRWMDKEVIK